MDGFILAAEITSAVGLKGEVRIKLFIEDDALLLDCSPLKSEDGRIFEVLSIRPQSSNMYVAKLKGVDDRNASELLKSAKLWIDKSKLPELEDEDDFYFHQLIGIECFDLSEKFFGKVTGVFNFGASDIIEIEREDGESVMYALSDETFQLIDVENKRITINPPIEI